ncbi:hypothetical protein O9993_02595 [Vibrio lentus]|nr:hypothetical protein [Vibrio lentus]
MALQALESGKRTLKPHASLVTPFLNTLLFNQLDVLENGLDDVCPVFGQTLDGQ